MSHTGTGSAINGDNDDGEDDEGDERTNQGGRKWPAESCPLEPLS